MEKAVGAVYIQFPHISKKKKKKETIYHFTWIPKTAALLMSPEDTEWISSHVKTSNFAATCLHPAVLHSSHIFNLHSFHTVQPFLGCQ